MNVLFLYNMEPCLYIYIPANLSKSRVSSLGLITLKVNLIRNPIFYRMLAVLQSCCVSNDLHICVFVFSVRQWWKLCSPAAHRWMVCGREVSAAVTTLDLGGLKQQKVFSISAFSVSKQPVYSLEARMKDILQMWHLSAQTIETSIFSKSFIWSDQPLSFSQSWQSRYVLLFLFVSAALCWSQWVPAHLCCCFVFYS